MMKLNDQDRKIVLAIAENNMNILAASRTLYMHRNTVIFHMEKIKRTTGLDPRKFYDLVELVELSK